MTSPWFEDDAAVPEESAVLQRGAPAPQPGALPVVTGLPTATHAQKAALWIVGAHGGAGETTLAQLHPGFAAAGHCWPREGRAVLVCRTTATGLAAAQNAAIQWASGAVPAELMGLVIIDASPGRQPKPLRELAAVISGGVPRTWHLNWIEAWRLGETPTPDTDRRTRRLVDDLIELSR